MNSPPIDFGAIIIALAIMAPVFPSLCEGLKEVFRQKQRRKQ